MKIDKQTKFYDTLTNSFDIVEYVKKYQSIKVIELSDMQELKKRIKKRHYDDDFINGIHLTSEDFWLVYSK